MAEAVVVVEGLSKSFGGTAAVEDLSFRVERGQVFGILGPNGAGKTTTLRVLMGLQRPTKGEVRLFGTTITPGAAVLGRVGALVEQAAFVPHLSGMRNLRLWWEAGGGHLRDADLAGALAIAGLGDAVHRKVRTYSQGMKQRLGLARLLLGRPELLVLDEPTNGLDPGEIREIRDLITRITAEGATVLLSSHHLNEVEQTCSDVLVMDRGRLVTTGPVRTIVGTARSALVEVDDRDRALTVIRSVPGVAGVEHHVDGLVVDLGTARRSDVAAAIVHAGLRLETIAPTQALEDVFLDLVSGADPHPGAAP
ncbi:MAG: ATP-binding cassette domain-containing protein [Actinomycetes bacterium]